MKWRKCFNRKNSSVQNENKKRGLFETEQPSYYFIALEIILQLLYCNKFSHQALPPHYKIRWHN